ncbi:MAG: hypothetical protein U0790_04060 [Isosphaeraceae bacterium]
MSTPMIPKAIHPQPSVRRLLTRRAIFALGGLLGVLLGWLRWIVVALQYGLLIAFPFAVCTRQARVGVVCAVLSLVIFVACRLSWRDAAADLPGLVAGLVVLVMRYFLFALTVTCLFMMGEAFCSAQLILSFAFFVMAMTTLFLLSMFYPATATAQHVHLGGTSLSQPKFDRWRAFSHKRP